MFFFILLKAAFAEWLISAVTWVQGFDSFDVWKREDRGY